MKFMLIKKTVKKYDYIVKIYYLFYWTFILFANLTGKVPVIRLRRFLYRNLFSIKIGKDSIIYMGARFDKPNQIIIGDNTIIGYNAYLDARRGIRIGNNVNVAGELRIFTMEHDVNSPSFAGTGAPVIIGDYTYIGTRAMILPGVTIGEGSVIASGAVVTKNVEPWTIVGGVPAKYIKNRSIVKYKLDTKNLSYFQ